MAYLIMLRVNYAPLKRMNEFALIQHFFVRPHKRTDVVLGSGDDAAIVTPPAGKQLIITTDTLVSSVHFPENTDAFDIGWKSLAVNLSDIAAMGGTAAWATGALTLPIADEYWLKGFADGLFTLAEKYNVALIGGDLTHGPLTITLQLIGFVDTGCALRRSGARAGDLIYVTHTLGDAALALGCLQNKFNISSAAFAKVSQQLNRPEPRLDIAAKIKAIATAAIDISDGLAADLQHILTASGVGAEIHAEKIPLSATLRDAVSAKEALQFALTGGDDYELCFTVAAHKAHLVPEHCHCIGRITANSHLSCLLDGEPMLFDKTGYQHF